MRAGSRWDVERGECGRWGCGWSWEWKGWVVKGG